MIYVKFTVESKLKKIISSNKKYSLQEASLILEKLEEYSKNNKSIESVEYSILENQDLLFRDRYITQSGNQTDIILLIKETLDTVFRDFPQGEKDLLLNKLVKSMNKNIDSSYEEIQNEVESEPKQEAQERRNQLDLEFKKEIEEKRNQLDLELKQEIEEKRNQLDLELKQEIEERRNKLDLELKQEIKEKRNQLDLELKQEAQERRNELDFELNQEIEEKRNQLDLEFKQEVAVKRKKLESELKHEKETIKNMKNNLNKELNNKKLLKQYIKKNEKLKKTMYRKNNIRFSISKLIFMICCIIIGFSLYKKFI